jgi:hypothetical protein
VVVDGSYGKRKKGLRRNLTAHFGPFVFSFLLSLTMFRGVISRAQRTAHAEAVDFISVVTLWFPFGVKYVNQSINQSVWLSSPRDPSSVYVHATHATCATSPPRICCNQGLTSSCDQFTLD